MIRRDTIIRGILLGAALMLMTTAATAGDRDYDERRDARADGLVYVENIAGSIRVEGWDKNEVHVTGTLGDDVEKVKFKTSGKKTHIEVVFPHKTRSIKRGADLVVMVPRGSRLEVECVSAPVTVEGVDGRIYASSISGDVDVDGGEDEVAAETISGNVRVRSEARQISVETISGRVEASGSRAKVEAEVVNGGVDLDFGVYLDLSVEAVNGSVMVKGDLDDGADCDIDVHSGNVTLILPADVKADFRIDTFNGTIDNAFGQKAHRTSKYAPGWELEFSVNGGGARVRINTFSGGVEIRRR